MVKVWEETGQKARLIIKMESKNNMDSKNNNY